MQGVQGLWGAALESESAMGESIGGALEESSIVRVCSDWGFSSKTLSF